MRLLASLSVSVRLSALGALALAGALLVAGIGIQGMNRVLRSAMVVDVDVVVVVVVVEWRLPAEGLNAATAVFRLGATHGAS
jgi:hypothetical protein